MTEPDYTSYKPVLETALASMVSAAPVGHRHRILEWGPGESTRIMVNWLPSAEIVTIEHDSRWFEAARTEWADNENVSVVLRAIGGRVGAAQGYATYPIHSSPATCDGAFDLAFVDGRLRCDCLVVASMVVSAYHGLVILHDSDRPNYRPGLAMFPYLAEFPELRTTVATWSLGHRAFAWKENPDYKGP